MRSSLNKSLSLQSLWSKIFKILVIGVNIVTYLVMCLGALKSLYFCFRFPGWEELLRAIVLTAFAIYINLKNPNI